MADNPAPKRIKTNEASEDNAGGEEPPSVAEFAAWVEEDLKKLIAEDKKKAEADEFDFESVWKPELKEIWVVVKMKVSDDYKNVGGRCSTKGSFWTLKEAKDLRIELWREDINDRLDEMDKETLNEWFSDFSKNFCDDYLDIVTDPNGYERRHLKKSTDAKILKEIFRKCYKPQYLAMDTSIVYKIHRELMPELGCER